MSRNPAALLVDVSGNLAVFQSGFPATGTVTGSAPGVMVAGSDGQFARLLKTTGDGTLQVTGSLAATGSIAVINQVTVTTTGSLPVAVQGQVGVNNFPAVQAISGSVSVHTQGPQLVSGTVNLGNWPPVVAVTGSQPTGSTHAGSPVVVGGVFTSGSYIKSLYVDVSGALYVTTSGSLPVTGGIRVLNQVTVTGSILSLPSGIQQVSGSLAVDNVVRVTTTGSLPVTGSVAVTGSVGITSRVTIVGAAASGSSQSGNPILVAGVDPSGSVRIPLFDYDGSTVVRQREEATFVCTVTGSAIGNNKSMLSILNASTSKVIRIREIWIMNVQTTTVTGIAGIFEFRRITGHGGGTLITGIEKMDTADNVAANVTIRTNGTVSGESGTLLWRTFWSTDEWGPGTLDLEGSDHGFLNTHPIYYRRDPNIKPITLWPNQGLNVKHVVNSTAGTFDIFIVFTQVP